MKTCTICHMEFLPTGMNQRYCSKHCQNIAQNKKKKAKYDPTKKREYYLKNKVKINKQKTIYKRNKIKNDNNYKLKANLRARLNKAIKGDYKAGSAVNDLGCSIAELKQYLESLFKPGMTWDNYGLRGWHIDHVEPLSKFTLSDPEELKKACNYTNLQPLWAKDNLQKGNDTIEL